MVLKENHLNGFDLVKIEETIEGLKSDPKVAEFRFRSRNSWISGFQTKSNINGFYGAKKEDTSRTSSFNFKTDMPAIFTGEDAGPTPPEYMLHALASCLNTTMMLLASIKGIKVDGVIIKVEGDINFNGFLGLDSCVLEEFEKLTVQIDIEGDFTDAEKQELLSFAQRSPVYKSMINPLTVDISMEINRSK